VKIQEGGGGRTSETPENGRNRRSRVSGRTDVDLIDGHEGEERSEGLVGRVDDGHVVHASGETEEGDWSEKRQVSFVGKDGGKQDRAPVYPSERPLPDPVPIPEMRIQPE
jgi:hypothetical protein